MEKKGSAREIIEQKLAQSLADLGIEADAVSLEHPGELAHGDYATGIALKYAKQSGKNPRELAEAIVVAMGTITKVAKIEIAGPGFINFTLTPEAIFEAIETARTDEKWGSNQSRAAQTIMVEYTDPNPFKQFHIGHLMSNSIGESIVRLLESSGATMIRANYQGDVGLHVGKAIWGYRHYAARAGESDIARWGVAYAYGSEQYESDEKVKAEIDQLGQEIFKSPASVSDYEAGKELSLAHFEELYEMLGTAFDRYYFESVTGPLGIEIVRAHPEVFLESEGAVVFHAEATDPKLHTRVFINRLGLPTYEAKDLGLLVLKSKEQPLDLSITITASEQSEYFKVVLAAASMLDETKAMAAHTLHISHGMMRFAEGKMSSRKGNVVTGESLLADLADAAKARASESRATDHEKLAEQIAVAAIKYQVLKQTAGKDIIFDRERALSLEGDSGPYLQYAYARTHAILERAQTAGVKAKLDPTAAPTDLARLIIRFPEIVARAAHEYEPHYLATYLIAIASAYNSWYAQVQILDQSEHQPHKVALVEAVSKTLKTGLLLLGIPVPEKM
jgi:arginyl-tRNA synthetase